MSKSRVLCLALCLPLLSGAHWAESNDAHVASGLRAYQAGDFATAVEEFRQALAGEGERRAVQFDLGTALVSLSNQRPTMAERERDLDLAIVSLRSARAAAGGVLGESVDYNLGNALVLRGRFSEAAAAYRAVLLQNSNHDDARHNLELALLALHAEEANQEARVRRLRKSFAPDAMATADDQVAQGEGDSLRDEGDEDDEIPAESAEDSQGAGAQDAGAVAGAAAGQQGGAQGDPGPQSPASAAGDGIEGAVHGERDEASEAAAAATTRPSSGSTLSLQKKLDALERRSAELRRASMLRKTTRRLRDPDKPGVDR